MRNFTYSMDVHGNSAFSYNVADLFYEYYGIKHNASLALEVEYQNFVKKADFDNSFKQIADEFGLLTLFSSYHTGYYSSRQPEGKREREGIYLNQRYYVSRGKGTSILIHINIATYGFISINVIYDDSLVHDDYIEKLYASLMGFMDANAKSETKKCKINFICESRLSGLYLKEVNIDTVVNDGGEEFDLENHYNDSFKDAYTKIMDSINGNKSKGLIMLHGFNGTGKTSFLRHLVTTTDRKIIYISPDMSARLSDPSFLTFLMDHKNSVLIIEDAENVLKSREAGMNQAVSNLLNVTDGILGDGLKFQVICTFNTSYDQIDHALKRPGRLLAEYEFTRLDENKTKALVKQIYGEDVKPKEKIMSLGEIFNMESTSEFSNGDSKSKVGIGFMSHING